MRIALITACSPLSTAADPCGLQLQPQSLARALARRGHRVTVYARNDSANYPRTAIVGGVSVEHVNAGPARPLSEDQAATHTPEFAASLADRWRVRPPDVVHAFSWTSGLAALGALRETAVPVVQTFGSLASAERRHASRGSVSQRRLRLETAVARSVALVLAGSTDEAAELGRLAVPRSAVRVVPAGVDTEAFSPDGAGDGRGDRPRLIAFATPGSQRGLAAVIRALAQLSGAELVVVGRDAQLLQLAEAADVRSRVTFTGEVTQSRLADLLRSCDVMVNASSYEPSGLAATHAMACGTPAVVSAVGGQRDAVIDGTTGLLVPPLRTDALVRQLRQLLARPALLQAYGIAAVDRARSRYSWDRIATETAAAYESCLAAGSADGATAQPAGEEASRLAAAFA